MLKEENITQCFHDAAKRKTTRPEVARVLKEEREVGNDRPEPQCLQEHVKALQKMLEEETYQPPEHKKMLTKTRGRALDFMGFVFHYNRTTLRKSILKRSTKKAHKLSKKEKINWYDASAMLSSMGWYTHTDTYGFYEDHIKPYVNIKKLKRIVSKHSKKGVKNNDVRMVSVRKHGQADRVGHDIKPDSGLSAKEHHRADQEGH